MKYQKLNTTSNTQDILLLNEEYFNICGSFEVKEGIITKIEIVVDEERRENIYGLTSAIMCSDIIKNKTIYYLIINLKDLGKPNSHQKVIIEKDGNNHNIKIDSGYTILTHIKLYEEDHEEIKSCNIDIYNIDFEPNPEHKNGNIVVGYP